MTENPLKEFLSEGPVLDYCESVKRSLDDNLDKFPPETVAPILNLLSGELEKLDDLQADQTKGAEMFPEALQDFETKWCQVQAMKNEIMILISMFREHFPMAFH